MIPFWLRNRHENSKNVTLNCICWHLKFPTVATMADQLGIKPGSGASQHQSSRHRRTVNSSRYQQWSSSKSSFAFVWVKKIFFFFLLLFPFDARSVLNQCTAGSLFKSKTDDVLRTFTNVAVQLIMWAKNDIVRLIL